MSYDTIRTILKMLPWVIWALLLLVIAWNVDRKRIRRVTAAAALLLLLPDALAKGNYGLLLSTLLCLVIVEGCARSYQREIERLKRELEEVRGDETENALDWEFHPPRIVLGRPLVRPKKGFVYEVTDEETVYVWNVDRYLYRVYLISGEGPDGKSLYRDDHGTYFYLMADGEEIAMASILQLYGFSGEDTRLEDEAACAKQGCAESEDTVQENEQKEEGKQKQKENQEETQKKKQKEEREPAEEQIEEQRVEQRWKPAQEQ